MEPLQTIVASVTFLSHEDGGRAQSALDSRVYRPHLVVGDPSQRVAHVGSDGVITEPYLGVRFAGEGRWLTPATPHVVTIELLYDGVDYSALRSGATFTIREGSRVVGFGTVIKGLPNFAVQPTRACGPRG